MVDSEHQEWVKQQKAREAARRKANRDHRHEIADARSAADDEYRGRRRRSDDDSDGGRDRDNRSYYY